MSGSVKRSRMAYPTGAASVLETLTHKMGVHDRLESYRVWKIWDEVVGPQTAQHAQPFRLRGGVLEVRVDHPVWMQQLQLLKPQMLERLNRAISPAALEDIVLRHGRPEPVSPPPARDAEIPLSPLTAEEVKAIDQILPPDQDDLHEAWRRLLARHLQSSTRRRS